MKVNKMKHIFDLAIAGGILLAGAPASAQVIDHKTDVILRLANRIQDDKPRHDAEYEGDCLVSSNNETRPSRFTWGMEKSQRYCGFPDVASLYKNGKAIWIHRRAYVPEAPGRDFSVFEMKLRRPGDTVGRCLFSNAAGTEPVLLSKPGGTGPFCGWTSEEIIKDKGALWEIWQFGSITSYKANKCLMFNDGDIYASLFRWGGRGRLRIVVSRYKVGWAGLVFHVECSLFGRGRSRTMAA